MSIYVYTALIGGFDFLKEQHVIDGVTYICYTDLQDVYSLTWNIMHAKPEHEHPRISAKRYKCLAHDYLPADCTYSIWIDASIMIRTPDFVPTCIESLKSNPVALMKHPMADCAYEEAKGCANVPKYRGERIMEQMAHYRSLGFPGHFGLAAGGIIVRDMKNPLVREIGKQWLNENLMWTYQDQLSLPYVLWKNKTSFDPLPYHLDDRTHFTLFNHLRND